MTLELVESAAVTLTTVRLLASHLTDANHDDVLERANPISRHVPAAVKRTVWERDGA